MVWTKRDKRSFGRWEMFLVSIKRALVACCTSFYDCKVSLLSRSLEAKPIAFYSRRSLELLARNVPGDWQDTQIQLSFDVYYIIESVQGLLVLLSRSRLPEACFFHMASRMVNYCSTVMHTKRNVNFLSAATVLANSKFCLFFWIHVHHTHHICTDSTVVFLFQLWVLSLSWLLKTI